MIFSQYAGNILVLYVHNTQVIFYYMFAGKAVPHKTAGSTECDSCRACRHQ